jgi:hypothetical protein
MGETEKDIIDEICCKLGFLPSEDRRDNLKKIREYVDAMNREEANARSFIIGIANNCNNYLED